MDEGKDCLIETACRLLGIWFMGNEVIGLVGTFIILGVLIYWGHHKRRKGENNQATHKEAS
jgi:hypothetical protein